jgi:hypothetical protein
LVNCATTRLTLAVTLHCSHVRLPLMIGSSSQAEGCYIILT